MNVRIISALDVAAAAVLVAGGMSTSEPRAADARASQVPPATKGVTIELLSTIDLGPEIECMQGRQLRTRRVIIDPGGVFGPVHDLRGRPGTVYILEGTITDHRNGVATDYGPGPGWPEDKDTIHWLESRGTTRAAEISVDIVSNPQ
jgi:mannose-6-phosphate isomerase-like protein (cupin superfamily)